MMRRTAQSTIAILACLLPVAACSLAAKAGLKVNGKSPTSSPKAASPQSAATPTPASSSPSAPVSGTTEATPAPSVADSVVAMPASLKVAAAPGAPVINLKGVSWCTSDVKGLDWDGAAERKFKREMKQVDDLHRSGMESLSSVGRFACGGTKSADRLSWVGNYMQARANETGMNQEHQTHLMGVMARLGSNTSDFVNYGPKGCEKFKRKGNPNRLVSEKNQAMRIGMGCAEGSNANWMAWWMDRGSNIGSHVGTLGWLYSTFAYSARDVSFHRGMMALHDAETFDQNAFFAELKERGADDEVIATAIIQVAKVGMKLTSWKKHHKEALGEDYDVLVKAAEVGFRGWEEKYKANKAAVDFAFQMEEAVLEGDKRAFAGCSETARKYATDFVMRDNPKTIEEIQSAAAHPIGSLIVAAAYECEKALGHSLLASVYAEMLKTAPATRGPRFASRLALVAAVAEIKAVKSRFTLKPQDFMPPAQSNGFGHTSTGYFVTGQGVIERVSKKGDTLEVKFKKESWKTPVYKCKETKRLDRIDSSGRLIYRKNCIKTGMKTESSQEKPISIPAGAGANIKAGAFMVIARSKKDGSRGLPRRVYKSKKRETLMNYYGLKLR